MTPADSPDPGSPDVRSAATQVRAYRHDESLGPWFQSLPVDEELVARAGTVGGIGGAGWRLDDLMLPAATIRASALANNGELFAQWCREHGVDFAPHGKTSMSPQVTADQLAAGAWAVTAAHAGQARMMRAWGVPRIIIANEVLGRQALAWVRNVLAADDLDLYVVADSVDAVTAMSEQLAGAGRALNVLVELGAVGGRAGVRDPATALDVARAIAASPVLRLAGVESFEGIHPQDRSAAATAAVTAMIDTLGELLVGFDREGLLDGETLITAGGSAYPDLVVDAWQRLPDLSVRVRRVVRSGGYIFHDHGMYERVSPFAGLRPSIEVWAIVLSQPEPGLSIVGFGKRDASFDVDLPFVLDVPDATVVSLNDQHAYVRHSTETPPWRVGDRVRFGLSHPCTVLDRWPLLPLLDDEDRVVGAVRTWF